MAETEKSMLRRNQQIADCLIGPILNMIDLAIATDSNIIDDMQTAADAIQHQQAIQAAMPFPESQRKSDETAVKLKALRLIIKLCQVRKEGIETMIKNNKDKKSHNEMLRSIGVI